MDQYSANLRGTKPFTYFDGRKSKLKYSTSTCFICTTAIENNIEYCIVVPPEPLIVKKLINDWYNVLGQSSCWWVPNQSLACCGEGGSTPKHRSLCVQNLAEEMANVIFSGLTGGRVLVLISSSVIRATIFVK